jgi:hypothetical protein
MLRIEHRPNVFEHRGLRKIFRSKWGRRKRRLEEISDRQSTYNVTLRRVRITIVVVERQ